jgi:GNAT superfamily N-acetyltransferase
MTNWHIEPLTPRYYDQIVPFSLGIQNGEFNLNFAPDAQADLLDIGGFYATGGFWIVLENEKVVGTIGLQKYTDSIGVLRKMFLAPHLRGCGIAKQLLDILLAHAKLLQLSVVYLSSAPVMHTAHRFYVRHGFTQISLTEAPAGFKYAATDPKVFKMLI